jgi:Signal peptidase I
MGARPVAPDRQVRPLPWCPMVDGAWPVAVAVVLPITAAAGVGVAVLRRRFVVVTVRGPSMEPVLREGDRVLVRRCGMARLRRGDLVVFAELPDPPDVAGRRAGAAAPSTRAGWLVKRAVAVAGDPVPREAGPALAALDDDVVPQDCLVAIGDNAAHSYDSRHYGYVHSDRLLGVVLRRL